MSLRKTLALALPALVLLSACDQKPAKEASKEAPSSSPIAQAVPVPAAAPQPIPMSKEEFEERAHAALVGHPEWLNEAVQALRMKQQVEAQLRQRAAVADNKAALFSDPTDFTVGNPEGAIVVVEFFDYQCPYCKGMHTALARILAENPDVKIVLKEYPILDPVSVVAAKAVLAGKSIDVEKARALHAALIVDRTPEHQLTEAHVMDLAKAAGFDAKALSSAMADPAVQAKIESTFALARKMGVEGTPAFAVGDELFPGALPYEKLSAAVQAARAAAKPIEAKPAAADAKNDARPTQDEAKPSEPEAKMDAKAPEADGKNEAGKGSPAPSAPEAKPEDAAPAK